MSNGFERFRMELRRNFSPRTQRPRKDRKPATGNKQYTPAGRDSVLKLSTERQAGFSDSYSRRSLSIERRRQKRQDSKKKKRR